MTDPFNTLNSFKLPDGTDGYFYDLNKLEAAGLGKISRLPVSVRVVLESVLRNCDGVRVSKADVERLAAYNAQKPAAEEIPFVVSRIVLQDFTGVPLLVDLAAMREAVAKLKRDPALIEPLVPVDMVVDHSVQVDCAGTPDAYEKNLELEFSRNRERYEFLKWGQQAFETFNVVPPSVGIVHQVNLEYLAKLVFSKDESGKKIFYPDTVVGTDSHTTMINGLGVVGWGVGGIEAEAGMLGQPVYFQTPEVVGVQLEGALGEGVTATDLALWLTELLRKEKVVGKFVEYFGEGAASLGVSDRATVANMAPEYGATMGYFGIDEKTLEFLELSGRDAAQVAAVKAYYQAQGLFGIPREGQVDYSKVIRVNLAEVVPSVSGPRRPQDRISLPDLKSRFEELKTGDLKKSYSVRMESGSEQTLREGAVLIAAITSCTNTSNPSVMLAAGLLAQKAVEKNLSVPAYVKASLTPGSRVVSDYLQAAGVQGALDALGFNLAGYGCATCIGNSGPLEAGIESAVRENNLVCASVLSGNRNFEARIHPAIKANFLMSPPLVVAFALAGTVDIDLQNEPLGKDKNGNAVYLRDIWPSNAEVAACVKDALKSELFRKRYGNLSNASTQWAQVRGTQGELYGWDKDSTYIQNPPFFENFSLQSGAIKPVGQMRALAIFGDSVTTDHISPAGSILKDGPAGRYLTEHGVAQKDFNSFGSRRGNDRVMTRGTFANVRIKNLMAGKEGGYTVLQPDGKEMAVYDACEIYRQRGESLIVFAGVDYGMGSSRDWAAKGAALLGVKAVVAVSFERIHRSNLIGMGVLPLQFPEGVTAQTLGLDGSEIFTLPELSDDLKPGQILNLDIRRKDGSAQSVPLIARIDTAIEVQYYRNGGILPYVLRAILNS